MPAEDRWPTLMNQLLDTIEQLGEERDIEGLVALYDLATLTRAVVENALADLNDPQGLM